MLTGTPVGVRVVVARGMTGDQMKLLLLRAKVGCGRVGEWVGGSGGWRHSNPTGPDLSSNI